tara:strand:+ start:1524 stop:1814 length:291 start_codon:yes stop_codon:yes gene_type:complete
MNEIFKNPLSAPLVLVEWFDAKDGETGWHPVEDIFFEQLATCQSVGWLIKDTKSQITIMSDYCEYNEEKDGGRHITIPGSWVNKIIYLEQKKEIEN